MMFAAGPLVGFAFGWWLDQKFHWDPWGKTILSLLGFVAGIRQVIQTIKKVTDETKETE